MPPQAVDLEEAVLGAILLESEKLELVMEIIPASDCFYKSEHQILYAGICRLFESGSKVDMLTITDRLRKSGELETIGGPYFLSTLMRDVVSSANVEVHSRIIMEHYMKREQIRIGGEMMAKGYDLAEDVFTSMDVAQEQLFQITSVGVKKDFKPVSSAVLDVMMEMDDQMTSGVEFTGVPTPFHNLNALTGGWQKNNLIILAARPAVGKTALSLCCALACSMPGPHSGGVGIFSMEMDDKILTKRMISNISNVPLKHVLEPWRLEPGEHQRVQEAAQRLGKLPIHIDDTSNLTMMELRGKARRMKKKHNIQLIIVDYLQLMEGSGSNGNREQEISKISRGLKGLSKDLAIPIIALSQLNRGVDTRADNEPTLSDLRESGAIEQDADVVMLLWLPNKKTLEKKPGLAGKAIMTVAKNRNGPTDEFYYLCKNSVQRWEEMGNAPMPYGGNNIPAPATHTPSAEDQDDLPF